MERRFHHERFSEVEKPLTEAEMRGESDPTERQFLKVAMSQGVLVYEAGMIRLLREKKGKGDKRSTVPDFLIKEQEGDEGIFVEVTEKSKISGNKGRQQRVMNEAGLGSRYVQITKQEIDQIVEGGGSLMEWVKERLAA